MNPSQSNPLQRELAKGKLTEPHLDDNVLTAFAEHTLTERERGQVMEHLANCAECREVMSVSVGATPEAVGHERPAVLPVRPPRWRWLPWVAVAAGVVLVSSTVLIHKRNLRMETQAGNAVVTTATAGTPPPPLPASTPPQQSEVVPDRATTQNELREAAPPQIQAPEAKKTQPPITAENDATEQQTDANLPLAAASRVSEPMAQVSAMSTATTSTQDASVAPSLPPAVPQTETVHGAMTAKAKSVPSPPAAAAPAFAGMLGGTAAMARSTNRPQWRINSRGQAERAIGYGTWQPVLTEEKARMRVVSVSGDEVWLGGESPRLYHSGDSGATWHMVSLPAKGSGNYVITHIRFTSAESGVVQADDGSEWDTNDGGKTWQ